ncbi:hypothetical protein GBA52_028506 [Prunus armeniaca]|nr:hypothetical protein GBA52_028506 [Prunus armeniaca]
MSYQKASQEPYPPPGINKHTSFPQNFRYPYPYPPPGYPSGPPPHRRRAGRTKGTHTTWVSSRIRFRLRRTTPTWSALRRTKGTKGISMRGTLRLRPPTAAIPAALSLRHQNYQEQDGFWLRYVAVVCWRSAASSFDDNGNGLDCF